MKCQILFSRKILKMSSVCHPLNFPHGMVSVNSLALLSPNLTNGSHGMANSVDPKQNAPLEAV